SVNYMDQLKNRSLVTCIVCASALAIGCSQRGIAIDAVSSTTSDQGRVVIGKDAQGDFTTQKPGLRRLIKRADLPAPYATGSAFNFPRVVPRPEGAWPKVPEGFVVT